jgi:hypothetical protein
MTQGKTLEGAHREALLDARRNALIQAHVIVEADARVADMRLTEAGVRSRATGYVQKMEVLESALVPGSAPPLYRVRVRALIQPLPLFSGPRLQGIEEDRWQPALTLQMSSDLPAEKETPLCAELTSALRRCGIAVVRPEERRPALSASISVSAAPAGGDAQTEVSWQIAVGLAGQEQPEEEKALPPAVGRWLTTQGITPEGEWWQRVAATMAQDAIRLWAMPRPTIIRFLGTDDASARRIAAALGSVPGSRLETAADSSEVQATLAIGGDPVSAIAPLLRSAGVGATLEPGQVSLTRLTYRVLPPTRPAAR